MSHTELLERERTTRAVRLEAPPRSLCKICAGGSLDLFAHVALCTDCGALMYYPYPTTAEVVESRFYVAGTRDIEASFERWYDQAAPRNHHNFTRMFEFALTGEEPSRSLDILDYGGGGGQFAVVAASLHRRARTFITDLFDNALLDEWAPFNTQIPFAAFPSDPRRFDYIFLNDVFEHVDDPVALLQLLAAKLKPKGKIFVDTPRTFWLFPLLRTVAPKIYARFLRATVTMAHLQLWTRKSFETAAGRAGLRIVHYRQSSEFTMGADYYIGLTGIGNPLVRAAGRAFYTLAPWIARNKIIALLDLDAGQTQGQGERTRRGAHADSLIDREFDPSNRILSQRSQGDPEEPRVDPP